MDFKRRLWHFEKTFYFRCMTFTALHFDSRVTAADFFSFAAPRDFPKEPSSVQCAATATTDMPLKIVVVVLSEGLFYSYTCSPVVAYLEAKTTPWLLQSGMFV